MFKRIITISLILILLISCKSDDPIEARMQRVLDNGIKKYHIHGVTATVIFPDNRTWTGISGFSYDTVKIKPDMLFAIGSITKNIIAALTLKLKEEKVITLDDPLSKWLPSYTFVDSMITIRQLLNHTSGLYMFWDNDELWEELKKDRQRLWRPEEVLHYIKEPYFAPGNGWRYSNTNYLLMAMIINKVTGLRLTDALKQHFWQPLGMKDVYLSQEDSIPESQVHVYGDNFQFGSTERDITFQPRQSHESIIYGSAGIFTTSENLARWSHELFGGNILNEESLKEMLNTVEFSPVSNMRAYGLGTQVYDQKFTYGEKAIGHGGANIGTSTYMVYFPEYRVSIVVMINAFPSKGIDIITKGLIHIVLKELNVLNLFSYFYSDRNIWIASTFIVVLIIIITFYQRKKRKSPEHN